MDKLKLESSIKLNKKTYELKNVVKHLYSLEPNDVIDFFKSLSLNMPRRLRMDVIKEVLKNKVKQTREESDSLADELNYRLQWFKEYSDTQCVNLLKYYDLDDTNVSFMESLWIAIINYMIESGVSEEHMSELFKNAEENSKKKGLGFSDIKAYNNAIDDIFYDESNHLDGLTPKKIRPVLFQSSTLVEIREIGKKYGVDVPKRLKKQQRLQIIFNELEERKQLTDELKETLTKMTVIAIQRYAMDNDIKVSTELNKEEIIEFILENAHQTNESYFKPEISDYHFDDEDTQQDQAPKDKMSEKQSPKEEAKEEPKANTPEKAPKEEAKEEPKANTPEKAPKEEAKEEPKANTPENAPKEPTPSESPAPTEPSTEKSKQEEQSSERPDIKSQGLFINAARVQRSKLPFKDDNLEIDGDKALLTKKERQQKIPIEIRFIWKFILFVFFVVMRIAVFALIIAAIVFTVLFIYGSVIHFSDIPSLDAINDILNSVKLFGKGILEHISSFYNFIGLES